MKKSFFEKYIFKKLTSLAVLVWAVSAMMLDSVSWIPTIICGIASVYLLWATFYWNMKQEDRELEEGEADANS